MHLLFRVDDPEGAHARHHAQAARDHHIGEHGARVVDDVTHEGRQHHLRQEVGAVQGRHVRPRAARSHSVVEVDLRNEGIKSGDTKKTTQNQLVMSILETHTALDVKTTKPLQNRKHPTKNRCCRLSSTSQPLSCHVCSHPSFVCNARASSCNVPLCWRDSSARA